MNPDHRSPRPTKSAPGKARDRALWALQALVAASFLYIGGAKLTSQPAPVELFAKLGHGQWPRYVTGAMEMAGAVLLLIPRLAWVGATLLVFAMVGATTAHLTVLGGSPAPALILGTLSAVIAWGRRPRPGGS